MTQEEKKLLEIELAARSQYGVICAIKPVSPSYELPFSGKHKIKDICIRENDSIFTFGPYEVHGVENIKPYLRPMSSMTEEEKWEEQNTVMKFLQDFYNERHLDYRGLIEKGLALEATEGMYKTETTMKAQETIDSLEAEKPSEGLEEEIKTRWGILNRSGNDIPFDTFNGVACHFAKWGEEHAKKDEIPVSDDIEETAEEIEPIPLTPEILEKNGFTNYGESWYIPKTEDCIMVGFHMYETTINITKDRVSFYKSVPCKYRSCYVNRKVFVHELQQAINLCGIEKQITV